MKVLICGDIKNRAAYKLENEIRKNLPRIKVATLVHSIPDLLSEIGHPMCGFSVFITFPGNKGDLLYFFRV